MGVVRRVAWWAWDLASLPEFGVLLVVLFLAKFARALGGLFVFLSKSGMPRAVPASRAAPLALPAVPA